MLKDMKKTRKNQNIVFDSLFLDKDSRNNWYELLTQNLNGGFLNFYFNFSKADKTFYYLNENLDTCISRLTQSTQIKPYVDEERIRENYALQKIPVENELPNTKIIVLKPSYSIDEICITH